VGFGLVANGAMAQDAKGTNVSIGGMSSRLSIMYRGQLDHQDHGLLKEAGQANSDKPVKTTNIELNDLKVGLAGKLSARSDYDTVLNMNFQNSSSSTHALIEKAVFNWWFIDMVGLTGGVDRINEGGWENKNHGYETMVLSPYTAAFLPLQTASHDSDKPVMALNVKAGDAGHVTLQLTDDTVDTSGEHFSTENKQPAMTLEYMGDFGGIMPLVQFGSYDANHSKYFDLGVGLNMMNMGLYFDFMNDNRAHKVPGKTLTDNMQTISLDLSYTLPGVAKPFLKYATYNNKQGVTAGDTEAKANPSLAAIGGEVTAAGGTMAQALAAAQSSDAFSDNGSVWSIGSEFLMEGNHYRPFLAFVGRSGKFLKGTTGTDSETKSDTSIKLGVLGNF